MEAVDPKVGAAHVARMMERRTVDVREGTQDGIDFARGDRRLIVKDEACAEMIVVCIGYSFHGER